MGVSFHLHRTIICADCSDVRIGERIKHHLERLDITQVELARRLKLRSPSAVSNWVTDQHEPATSRLPDIAAALGMTLSTFFAPLPKRRSRGATAP